MHVENMSRTNGNSGISLTNTFPQDYVFCVNQLGHTVVQCCRQGRLRAAFGATVKEGGCFSDLALRSRFFRP